MIVSIDIDQWENTAVPRLGFQVEYHESVLGVILWIAEGIAEFYLAGKCQSDGKDGENGKARHFEKIVVITIEFRGK